MSTTNHDDPHASEPRRMAVLGAGTMGHGIAQVAALAGLEVHLYDVSEAALDAGLDKIRANLEASIARGKLAAEALEPALARLGATTSLADAVDGASLVVEAVPERLELKQQLFAELAALTDDDTVLATNTSSFSIDALADAAEGCAERVIGLHFFNPVHIMRLLEIVVGPRTSEAVVAQAFALAEALGKTPIRVKDAPGFATSRLGIALAMEAIRMVEQGVASPADIDTAMELGYRHPMGPLRLTDLVGLDVRLDITRYLHAQLGTDTFAPPPLLEKMVAEGRLGRKVGRGFYDYTDD